ncbi:MAG: family 43 glycosylhydrolase, partial [Dysgonamonadaceae bacterium]|nr:family 43 glycosylhydrolase [Dysgonamonadaceae bacterium]
MRTIIIILLVTLNVGASAQSWTNPLTLNDEWPQYGIGDPYILKHRGVYYLYCSTKDNSTGVKCWSTKDFVTWSGPYNCTGEAITKTAYAPEVVYWNGTFYMYTSPGGNGHYVLSSNSPTGPFTRITENLGKSIDGSIFIDDNGAWYFYHAAEAGIQGCRMSSPTTIEQDVDLNARMGNGWTEGPTVVKRGGVYYLIYTGNHVISKGYRIDYAQNTTGPISAYTPQSRQNPILINTEGAFVGLGHGSAFIGPDLDTYYYTYHNLESGSGPRRHLNFDRMAWNGTKLLLLGPTNWPQEPFRMADMCDFFDRDQAGENLLFPNGGDWRLNDRERLTQEHSAIDDTCLYKALLKPSTDDDYTAEFTFKYLPGKSDDARFGAVFGYTDEANYGIALWNCRTNRLEINFMTSAHWETPRYANLPSGYRPEVWHHLRIEKAGTSHRFFVDGQQKAAIEKVTGGGKIGYATSRCQADFAYIAFSNQVNGSAIGNTYKPLPGSIAAVHCNTEGIGREKATTVDAGTEGGYAIVARGDERYSYKINPKAAGRYHLALRYSANEASRIRIRQGEREVTGVVALPMTANRGTNWQTLTV